MPRITSLITRLLNGSITPEAFRAELAEMVSIPRQADIGEAVVDLERQRRCGFPEVIYGEGKRAETIAAIIGRQREHGIVPLATRVSPEKAEVIRKQFPDLHYNPRARLLRGEISVSEGTRGKIAVISAGTSDLAVAEEAFETALWTGSETVLIADVGVAGPYRLQARLSEIQRADAMVVVAGMEGALPSVVGGYVAVPVIAVPTSVGYGTAFGGVTALLGMLNSCASNVTVVNIDAGFKAGYVAGLIARKSAAR